MSYTQIQQLLKQKIGLDTETIGNTMLQSSIKKRVEALQLDDIDQYAALLADSTEELNFLIDDITIPETWFFRDHEPFDALKRFVRTYLSRPDADRQVNILSIPSSTGEEPYSIAMSLDEAGIASDRFSIHALDICTKSLNAAKRGIYTRNSFRGHQREAVIRKYFTVDESRYILSDRIKDMVTFERGNIVDPSLKLPHTSYHVIFCRNLLIYFDNYNKSLAYNRLHALLHDDGQLFIGHSESGAVPQDKFTHTGIARSFSYTKTRPGILQATHSGNGQQQQKTRAAANTVTSQFQRRVQGTAARNKPAPHPARHMRTTQEHAKPDLELAQSMADSGRLDEAQRICNEYLQLDNKNPQAYYLLGLTNLSDNNLDAAESNLRKAIYLDPGHYEALSHLALLLEQSGDASAAELLRKRAQRAASKVS